MKFIIRFFIFLTTFSTVFSYRTGNHLVVRANIDTCRANFEEIVNLCYGFDRVNKKESEDICNAYKNEKCKNYFENGLTSLTGCENLSEENKKKFIFPSMNQIYEINVKLLCSTDVNGKKCPYAKVAIDADNTNNNSLSYEEYKEAEKQAIQETCKSKKCIDITREYLNVYINNLVGNADPINELKASLFDVLVKLNAKNCTDMAYSVSGAFSTNLSIKINSIFVIIFIGSLLYFL